MRYARCDYCGGLFPTQAATLHWVHAYDSEDGREVCTTGIFCSAPCAEWSSGRLASSRG